MLIEKIPKPSQKRLPTFFVRNGPLIMNSPKTNRTASVYKWQIPMDVGVALRAKRISCREGLYIELRSEDRCGWGEISPLPGFSAESLEEAQDALLCWTKLWLSGEEELPKLPSAAFGISCALAELNGTLPMKADYRTVPLGGCETEKLVNKLAGAKGEKTAKVKVGFSGAANDGITVDTVLHAVSDVRLRLDANRSWTLSQALDFAQNIRPHYRERIAFIEEPCQSREESRIFARQTGIAIAWDESLRESDFTFDSSDIAKAVVIKPTLTGSLEKIKSQTEAARRLGMTAVISSSLESSLGLTQLARIAAWLTPNTIPGLDTLNLMRYQQIRPWPHSTLELVPAESLQRLI